MRAGTIGRVYATSLLREAERAEAVEAVDESLAALVDTLEASPKFRRFLHGPQIAGASKKEVLSEVFGERIHPLALRFLLLVVDKHREPLVEEIVAAWREILDERANRQSASVTSAAAMDETVIERIREALERRTGKTILLDHRIDPELLGGLVVRAGDTVIDGSLKTRLRTLRRRLRAAGVP